MAAFHFQFANQAAWKCGPCRRAGLEARRRCGWTPGPRPDTGRVVWARKGVAVESCPRSYITAQSLTWVEEFLVRRKLGLGAVRKQAARDVEAYLILEREWGREFGDGV